MSMSRNFLVAATAVKSRSRFYFGDCNKNVARQVHFMARNTAQCFVQLVMERLNEIARQATYIHTLFATQMK